MLNIKKVNIILSFISFTIFSAFTFAGAIEDREYKEVRQFNVGNTVIKYDVYLNQVKFMTGREYRWTVTVSVENPDGQSRTASSLILHDNLGNGTYTQRQEFKNTSSEIRNFTNQTDSFIGGLIAVVDGNRIQLSTNELSFSVHTMIKQ